VPSVWRVFWTYLRRELSNRRKQTVIVAVGMALAIALVIVVNSLAAGVRSAQATALESVYGVGTDITITQAAAAPTEGEEGQGPGRFEFGADEGETQDGSTVISQSRLSTGMGGSTFDASALDTAQAIDGVAAASATLSLTNTTFNGELPDSSSSDASSAPTSGTDPGSSGGGPGGGFNGAGGSAFDVDSFSVLGVDPSAEALGPLASIEVSSGRGLESSDAGTYVALLDSNYATSSDLAVGDTITIADTDFEIVGVVSSTSTSSDSASNVYIPLDVAQSLSGLDGQVSTIYVQASSASAIDTVQAALQTALPDTTVNTESDLAETITGSLGTASSMIANLGTWLSVIVLAAAILIAALLTISGVTRRTREFGTLKAIGWSNGRVVRQVAGESLAQSLIGAAVGTIIGAVASLVISAVGITLSASGASGGTGQADAGSQPTGMPTGGAFGGGMGGGMSTTAVTASDVTLTAPLNPTVILLAIALAVLGGLIAGAVGGWRASRLRPAEALRSIA